MNLSLNEGWLLIVGALSAWVVLREFRIGMLTKKLYDLQQERQLASVEQINEILSDAELNIKLDKSLGRKPEA